MHPLPEALPLLTAASACAMLLDREHFTDRVLPGSRGEEDLPEPLRDHVERGLAWLVDACADPTTEGVKLWLQDPSSGELRVVPPHSVQRTSQEFIPESFPPCDGEIFSAFPHLQPFITAIHESIPDAPPFDPLLAICVSRTNVLARLEIPPEGWTSFGQALLDELPRHVDTAGVQDSLRQLDDAMAFMKSWGPPSTEASPERQRRVAKDVVQSKKAAFQDRWRHKLYDSRALALEALCVAVNERPDHTLAKAGDADYIKDATIKRYAADWFKEEEWGVAVRDEPDR